MKDVAPGHIEIRASLIKKVAPLIVEPFTHFLSLFLKLGIVPRDLKVVKVIPLFNDDEYHRHIIVISQYDDEKYFLGIFPDLPKAFGTVNFKILLITFNNIGILFLNGFIVTFLKENNMSLLITRIPIDLNLYVGFPKVPFWTLSYF